MHSSRPLVFPQKLFKLQQEPVQHKSNLSRQNLVLKKSLKITLKSKQKINNKIPETNRILQQSCRLSKSIVHEPAPRVLSRLKRDIDNRLNRVYSSLAKHSSIQLTGAKNSLNQQISFFKNPSAKYEPFAALINENIRIQQQLPYQLLKQYINSIYSEYQIKDPLHRKNPSAISSLNYVNSTPLKSNFQNERKISTKKKILNLKKDMTNQLYSITVEKKKKLNLSTPRKFMTFKTNNNQYSSSYLNQHQLNTHTKIKANLPQDQIIEEIPRIQPFKFGEFYQKSRNQTLTDTKYSISDSKYVCFNSTHKKINDSAHYIKNTEVQSIPQVYRYCFVCQQQILQFNLSSHEGQCLGLKQLLLDKSLTKQRLLQLVNQKILRLQRQIQNTFLSVDQRDNSVKLSDIKLKVVDWIRRINAETDQKVEPKRRKSLNQYQFISQAIRNTNLLKSFELISKLNWFNRLKNNFEQKHLINEITN